MQKTTLSKAGALADELTTEDFLRIVTELRDLGCSYVELHGGEPTLNPDLPIIVRKCTDLGVATMITTNGLSMTPGIAQKLVEAGIHRVNFSLDGPRECHNDLRGRDNAFDKMMDAMRMIREADQNNRVVKNINTMVSTVNIHRIEEVIPIAAENKIDIVTFVHPSIMDERVVDETNAIFGEMVASYRTVCSDEFLIQDLALIETKREAIKAKAKQYRVKCDKTNFFTMPVEDISRGIKRYPKPCWEIYGCILIDATGNVAPCELLRFDLGNLKTRPLGDILQSDRYETFTRIYCENIENLDLCKYCVDAIY